ncbi:MAG TPA: hypothetical protein DD379_04420 [Cyanobacteria bacterium UBA11162]|nr:hypothetical protein [Cyanobacteria bacterium UBA11162]
MPTPQGIEQPKQLIVEGQDAVYFFRAFLKHLNITDIQIQNYGGIRDLRFFLKALSLTPDFATLVTSIGIVRDAETDKKGAFMSGCCWDKRRLKVTGIGIVLPLVTFSNSYRH